MWTLQRLRLSFCSFRKRFIGYERMAQPKKQNELLHNEKWQHVFHTTINYRWHMTLFIFIDKCWLVFFILDFHFEYILIKKREEDSYIFSLDFAVDWCIYEFYVVCFSGSSSYFFFIAFWLLCWVFGANRNVCFHIICVFFFFRLFDCDCCFMFCITPA